MNNSQSHSLLTNHKHVLQLSAELLQAAWVFLSITEQNTVQMFYVITELINCIKIASCHSVYNIFALTFHKDTVHKANVSFC